MSPNYARENELARQRLSRITGSLTAEDFSRPLLNGWTVVTKLAHLAFWDMYYLACIEGWERTGFVANRVNVDAVNETVRALSRAIPNDSVVQMVRDAAEAIDRKVESIPPELASSIEAGGQTRILHRALHRSEHLDQIENALKP